MKLASSILFLFLALSPLSAGAICLPCDPCWIASVGGPILEPGSVTDTVSRGYAEAKKQFNYVKEQTTAFTNKAITTLQAGATAVMASMDGVTLDPLKEEGNTGPKEIIIRRADPATSHVKNIMKSNMELYADMPFSDHEGDYNFIKKREYIRQQANLQMMARILVLKSKTETIFDIIDDMEKKIDASSKKASNQSSLENDENKVKLLLTTAAVKIAWIKLLMIQKQLRAAQLQYNAYLGLASAKRNKTYWNPEEELPEEN